MICIITKDYICATLYNDVNKSYIKGLMTISQQVGADMHLSHSGEQSVTWDLLHDIFHIIC